MASSRIAPASESRAAPREERGRATTRTNVGGPERIVSVLGGAALAAYGLKRHDLPGLILAAAAGTLLYRGTTGHSSMYSALGVDTAGTATGGSAAELEGSQTVEVHRSQTINRPRSELYQFWRDFQNLPRFMDHLQSVSVADGSRSHWVTKGPAGSSVEWDAVITADEENERVAWESLEGSEVANAGEVRFLDAPGARGTEVHVAITVHPPAGKLGAVVARLFGEHPDTQVREDLRHFKQLMEAGEIPTIEGQPSCRA